MRRFGSMFIVLALLSIATAAADKATHKEDLLTHESREFLEWLALQYRYDVSADLQTRSWVGLPHAVRESVAKGGDGGIERLRRIRRVLNGDNSIGTFERLSCKTRRTCTQLSSFLEKTNPKCHTRSNRREYTFVDLNDGLGTALIYPGRLDLSGDQTSMHTFGSISEHQYWGVVDSLRSLSTEFYIDRLDGEFRYEKTEQEVVGGTQIERFTEEVGECQILESSAQVRREAVLHGTCFSVSPTQLLTSHHVIDGAKQVTVQLSDGRTLEARVEQHSKATDLALLSISEDAPSYLPLADVGSVSIGDHVFTIGFPVPNVLGRDAKFTEGSVSSLAGLGGDSSFFQMSVPIQPGNSGGPVVNMRGEVVGIVAATAAVEAFYARTNALPQSINWASKADFARVMFTPARAESLPEDRVGAIERVRTAVCQVAVIRGG